MQQGSHHLDIICELENVGTPVEGAALLLEVALAGLRTRSAAARRRWNPSLTKHCDDQRDR